MINSFLFAFKERIHIETEFDYLQGSIMPLNSLKTIQIIGNAAKYKFLLEKFSNSNTGLKHSLSMLLIDVLFC